MPEVIADGQTGLLVPPGDAAALADALQSLLDDQPRLARMGKAAAAYAKSTLNWEIIARVHADAYQSAIKS